MNLVLGAREIIRQLRASDDGDLLNSVIGGISSGSFLGRLQGKGDFFIMVLSSPQLQAYSRCRWSCSLGVLYFVA